MKRKLYINFLLTIIAFSLTSCFEVIEEVSMGTGGNGVFSVTVNLSQSKTQIDKLLLKDSVGRFRIPKKAEIENSFLEIETKLKSMKGISNVQISKDFVNHIFSLKCNFTDLNSLNTAINKIWSQYDKMAPAGIIFYSGTLTSFSRNMDPLIFKNIKPKIGSQEKDVLNSAKWTMIYRFPKPILTFTNKKAAVSKSGKAIIFNSSILPVINGSETIQNTIKLNP